MKKNKVQAQLRKIATREAIEKRRNSRPSDPFLLLELGKGSRTAARADYDDYDDEDYEEYEYG